jgi:hypothetical protein
MEMLLTNGANINAKSREHGTALLIALSRDFYRIVETLLGKGADVNVQGGEYGSALIGASSKGHEKLVETLLSKGADANARDAVYGHALLAASSEGHEGILEMLLKKSADIKADGRYRWGKHPGKTTHALEEAAAWGHDSIVEMLLKKAVEVDLGVGYYSSALQAASSMGWETTVELLKKGAKINLNIECWGGATSSSWAKNYYPNDSWFPPAKRTQRTREEIEIYVRTLTGRYIIVNIRVDAKCIDLKDIIMDKEGSPHHDQYLIFRQRWLPEQVILRERGVSNESLIHVVLPIWGFRHIYR